MQKRGSRVGLGSSKGWVAIASAVLCWSPERAVASDPAVAETNFRIGVDYAFSSVETDFEYNPGQLGLGLLETELHELDFGGVIVIPVAHAVGLRVSGGPNYSRREVGRESSSESEDAGLRFGGELFFRDPDRFEIGGGPRYAWDEPLDSHNSDSVHSLAGIVYGRFFLGGPAVVPIDIGAFVEFGELNLGEDDRLGGSTEYYEAGGGLTVYPHPRVAIAAGGSYREEESSAVGDLEREIVAGRFFVDFLAFRRPGLILGPRAEVGEIESSLLGFDGFEQEFFSVGLGISLNFPGADSLVALSRRYF